MIWFLLALMFGTMLMGVPILLAIALVGYVGVAAIPDLVLPLFAQKMFAQLDSFTLLALPYFILAGGLMSASGMSQQLVDFSRVLVGHLRAGLAHASVVASMVFAGISGSSTADAAAIGAVMIPTMKKSGYKAGFAAALIATAGTIGAIIPPSMVMVVYNQIGSVSPPTAPLLFVTTSIAQTTFSEVNRHVWWFMLAEVLVVLLVIFIPGLASWIPHYFLG
jgi:TRAP-type C4-dicarboxylate transport system permease large subunit